MIVGVVNRSSLSALDVKRAVSAVNQQVTRHFRPAWSIQGSVTLGTKNADAVMYLQDEADVDDALGYHDQENSGKPCGFVFPSVSEAYGEPWSVTLSHEVLELLGNPHVYGYALGKHPTENRDVLYWTELCDAVQADTYAIGGVDVSNFVLPFYFTRSVEPGIKNDYLGTSLKSLGLNPGGYLGYYDPLSGEDETYFPASDAKAKKRHAARQAIKGLRRSNLYQAARARTCVGPQRKR